VRQVTDPQCADWLLDRFVNEIWPEALRDFSRCGVTLNASAQTGDIRRSPSGRPVFTQLGRGVINVVLTERVPLEWDEGRALAGVTTVYEGRHVCLIALRYAHCHQIPFLSVNTCVHEILHALLHDVFERRPPGLSGNAREFRIDYYATRLWLFREGTAVREAARVYADRLLRLRDLPRSSTARIGLSRG
jgi:hypothetical protein